MCLGRGRVRGRLTGGNLSLISALEGTPFAVDASDAILLLEDTREAPYRIDRMLRQLQLAGKLDTLRGAVLGQFTRNFSREDEDTDDPRYSVEGVLRQYFEPLGIPVLMNFPVGHHPMNATLPLGGRGGGRRPALPSCGSCRTPRLSLQRRTTIVPLAATSARQPTSTTRVA